MINKLAETVQDAIDSWRQDIIKNTIDDLSILWERLDNYPLSFWRTIKGYQITEDTKRQIETYLQVLYKLEKDE